MERRWAAECDAADDLFSPYEDEELLIDVEYVDTVTEEVIDRYTYFDHIMADGQTLAQHVLSDGTPLTQGERRYIEAAADSPMRLFEIVEVSPGNSLRLRDVLDGDEVTVREIMGSRSAKRWDLMTARVVPCGASGQPEMDSSVLSLPRQQRDSLVGSLRDLRQTFERDHPTAGRRRFWAEMTPLIHDFWLGIAAGRHLPRMTTTEGEELVPTEVYFEVPDVQALRSALDGAQDFVSEGDGAWQWLGPKPKGRSPIIRGWLKLQGERLVLSTHASERAEKCCKRIERIAGDAVRRGLRSHTSVQHLMRQDFAAGPDRADAPQPEELEALALQLQDKHYRSWIDESIPALDGATPRAAASSVRLRPRLVEMIKDLENMYLSDLGQGRPAYDPSWMWTELGLADHPDAPATASDAFLTGYESLASRLPKLREAAITIAKTFAARPDFDPTSTMDQDYLETELTFRRFVNDEMQGSHAAGNDPEVVTAWGNLVATHLQWAANFEAHLRKTFVVDESLAWMLGSTRLDLSGDQLRPPFASFAIVLHDRNTLAQAERLLSKLADCELRGQPLRAVTAYVTEVAAESGRVLKFALLFDALAGQWPYLLARDLYIRPDDQLDAMLASHVPDVESDDIDAVFHSAGLQRLLHVLINVILYASSPDGKSETRTPARGRRARPTGGTTAEPLLSDAVFFLPGPIDIRQVRQLQQIERSAEGGKLMHRFMVRGHWRRPAKRWKDQRPRWIRPHWKGPDMAAVIERSYRLRE